MRSPKYKFSEAAIAAAIAPKSLQKAWKNKIKAQLRKQLIWDLIEFRDIDADLLRFVDSICRDIREARYTPKKPDTYLIEKSRGLCRQMMLVWPRDLVVLQSISSILEVQLRSSAPTGAAFFQPGDMKWSQGKMTSEISEYGGLASWLRFQKAILNFSRENKFLVITDVANFYDFINFSHLRNIIASLCRVNESLLDLLIFILNELSWVPDFMPRQETGMPQIESEAPRVLANSMLYELDKVAEGLAPGNYARFMDDVDCGANSISEAKKIVRDIDLTLQSRQLRLNSSKTKILDQKAAHKHFCVQENEALDALSSYIQANLASGPVIKAIGTQLSSKYEKWYERTASGGPAEAAAFRQGNGDKIHKRTITLLHRCGTEAPLPDMAWLVRNDPRMRPHVFRVLQATRKPNTAFNSALKIMQADVFVDDQSYMSFADFCAHAKFKKTPKFVAGISEAYDYIRQRGFVGAYASTILVCRFGGSKQIFDHLKFLLTNWRGSDWLARAAAGLVPRLHHSVSDQELFEKEIGRFSSQEARSVLEHHQKLRTSRAFVISQSSYLVHPNDSFPQGIFLPKALQILSVRQNTSAAKEYSAILAAHSALSKDPFFVDWGF